MNFFKEQERARRNTGLLIFLFILAVLATVFLSDLPIIFAYHLTSVDSISEVFQIHPIDYYLTKLVSSVSLIVITGAILHKFQELSEGGRIIAESMGGRLSPNETLNWLENDKT